jgi:hypothetical protein
MLLHAVQLLPICNSSMVAVNLLLLKLTAAWHPTRISMQGFTWLTASPAAEQAAAAAAAETGVAAAAAAASHGGSSRLPPVYGCHATNTSAQLDLDAAAQTLATVPAADAVLVQLLDDGLGQAVRAFGRAGPRPVAEHRLLEANLFGILLPVIILR